jgi:hypothetical protein
VLADSTAGDATPTPRNDMKIKQTTQWTLHKSQWNTAILIHSGTDTLHNQYPDIMQCNGKMEINTIQFIQHYNHESITTAIVTVKIKLVQYIHFWSRFAGSNFSRNSILILKIEKNKPDVYTVLPIKNFTLVSH